MDSLGNVRPRIHSPVLCVLIISSVDQLYDDGLSLLLHHPHSRTVPPLGLVSSQPFISHSASRLFFLTHTYALTCSLHFPIILSTSPNSTPHHFFITPVAPPLYRYPVTTHSGTMNAASLCFSLRARRLFAFKTNEIPIYPLI